MTDNLIFYPLLRWGIRCLESMLRQNEYMLECRSTQGLLNSLSLFPAFVLVLYWPLLVWLFHICSSRCSHGGMWKWQPLRIIIIIWFTEAIVLSLQSFWLNKVAASARRLKFQFSTVVVVAQSLSAELKTKSLFASQHSWSRWFILRRSILAEPSVSIHYFFPRFFFPSSSTDNSKCNLFFSGYSLYLYVRFVGHKPKQI